MDNINQKIVYRYVDVERSLCIKFDEIKALLSQYPYGHPYRIGFALLACTGMRSQELCDLYLSDFLKSDCTELRYRMCKNLIRSYTDGTTRVTVKVAKRTVPKVLGDEILWYVEHNAHLLKDGKLLRFSPGVLRKQLSNLRLKAEKGQLDEPFASALLEKCDESFVFGGNCEKRYRIGLHSFRRFYVTMCKNTDFPDLSELCRHVGHSMRETTMKYIYRPEFINLPKGMQLSVNGVKGLLFDKGQTHLTDFSLK